MNEDQVTIEIDDSTVNVPPVAKPAKPVTARITTNISASPSKGGAKIKKNLTGSPAKVASTKITSMIKSVSPVKSTSNSPNKASIIVKPVVKAKVAQPSLIQTVQKKEAQKEENKDEAEPLPEVE